VFRDERDSRGFQGLQIPGHRACMAGVIGRYSPGEFLKGVLPYGTFQRTKEVMVPDDLIIARGMRPDLVGKGYRVASFRPDGCARVIAMVLHDPNKKKTPDPISFF
jgi:hypothetical protein